MERKNWEECSKGCKEGVEEGRKGRKRVKVRGKVGRVYYEGREVKPVGKFTGV